MESNTNNTIYQHNETMSKTQDTRSKNMEIYHNVPYTLKLKIENCMKIHNDKFTPKLYQAVVMQVTTAQVVATMDGNSHQPDSFKERKTQGSTNTVTC